MKFKKLKMFLFMLASFFIASTVYAATYDINIIPVNVTTVSQCSDLSTDTGKNRCYNAYRTNKLNSYIITNGVVEPGQKIMNVVEVVPGSGSTLTGIKLTLNNVSTQTSMLGIIAISQANYTKMFPGPVTYEYDEEKDEDVPVATTTWSASYNAPSATSAILMADKGDNINYPLVNASPIWAVFYEVKSTVSAGQDINFNFGTSLSDTNASDKSGNNLTLSPHNLTLSVLSNVSVDGTLKTLTAKGSNNLNYPFGFVPSSKTDLTYSFIVPNAVNKIRFSGEPTDSNAKGVVGLDVDKDLTVGDNNITIAVTAESGDITNYSITVRRLSADTSLKTFSSTNDINFGTVASINSNSGSNITIDYKKTSSDITATTTHSDAQLTGTGTWNYTTDNATNVVTTKYIDVQAEDCRYSSDDVPGNICTEKRYTFNVTRKAPSKNVKLSDLTIDGTTITGFSKTKYTYTLDAFEASKSTMTIGATVDDTLNTIVSIVGPGSTTHTPSGSGVVNTYSTGVNVNVGDNTYVVTVKSEDGTTTQTYTINVHRKSNETLLQTMSVTSNPIGTLTPDFVQTFDSTSGEYKYTYDPNVTQVTVSAVAKDTGKAYVSIIDMSSSETVDNSVKTINSASKQFDITTTKVGVIVTAEDGSTRVYKVKLDRQKSTNNYLSALSINPGTIKETFSSTKGSYTAEVDPEVTSTTVSYTLADSNSELTAITGNDNFQFGSGNIITVTVTSESGSVNTYSINVTRKSYAIATLSDLRVGLGTATPTTVSGFGENVFEYTISTEANPIPYTTSGITIEADKKNEYATVTGDTGSQTLNPGNNQFKITVTSQDTKVVNTYIINAYRQKNTDNETKGIIVAGVNASATSDPKVFEVTLPNSQATLAPSEVVISVSPDATLNKPNTTMNLSTTTTNVYNYSVTSDSGATENYVINITRTKSNNANISRVNLYLGDETTSTRYCVMADSENSCRIEVPQGTTGYRLEAIINAAASVSPDNSTVYTMGTALADSTQTRKLTVTAEDNTPKEYTITVERAKSTNANLSDIIVTDITDPSDPIVISLPPTCHPIGQPLSQTCNLVVPSAVKTIQIEANTEDAKASITTGLQTALTLPFGNLKNEIKVVAENTTVDKTYTLNITRSLGDDATLNDLKVSGASLAGFDSNPDPDDGNFDYTYANQDYDTVQLTVAGITNDTNAKITRIYNVDSKGTSHEVSLTASNNVSATVPLTTGSNVIHVIVTAHNNTNTAEYTISLNRTLNSSTAINGIKVAGVDAVVDSNDSYKYTVVVPNSVDEASSSNVVVDVASGKLSTDPKATYSVPTLSLETLDNEKNPVDNTLIIPVTAEDGTLKNYTVIITRTTSNVAKLNRVNLYVGDETTTTKYCVLEDTDVACSIPVNVTTTAFRLEGILADSKSSVEFSTDTETGPSFLMPSGESTKVITALVTAENGTDTKTYTITIERAQSSNNYLSSLKTNANSTTMNTVPMFAGTKSVYDIVVPGTQSQLDVYAKTEDDKSKVTSVIVTTTSATTTAKNSNEVEFNADLGESGTVTKVEIVVTAENGNPLTYTLNVTRQKNIEPRLSMITINGNSINNYLDGVTFDPDVTEYTIYDFTNTKQYGTETPHNFPYLISSLTVDGTNVDTKYGTRTGNGSIDIQTIYYNGHDSSNNYVNDIVITGVAQDTSVYQEYTIHVKRDANNSTAVAKVEMEYGGSLHTATYNNGAYNITVPNYVVLANDQNVIVTPETPQGGADDNVATVTMGSTTLLTNNTSNPKNLNTHKFTVTAEDGTTKEYRLLITREYSDVSILNDILIQDADGNDIGLWTPSFKSDKLSYTIVLGETTSEFYVIPVKAEDNEKITGIPSNGRFELTEAQKRVTVVSTAESGNSATTYELTIVREANNNNDLGTITVEDESGTEYTVETTEEDNKFKVSVPGSAAKVIITATAVSGTSTVKYINPDADTTNTYSIPVGVSQKEVQIRSEAGVSKSYYIEITRAKKTDATLSSLSYTYTNDGIVHNLDLSDGDKDFVLANVPYGTSQVYITAVANDAPDATVSGHIRQQSIAPGPNKFTITVTAQDGTTTEEYTITVEREKNNDATLKMLNITGESLNETFARTTYDYTMDVPATKKKLLQSEITAVPNDSNATVVLDPDLILSSENLNIYKITVTAANGVTQQEYTITITRPKSSDATLKEVNLTGATLSPSVSPTTKSYTITVPYGATGFDIEGVPNSEDAEVYGNGHIEKNSGSITLNVIAEDGTTSIYTFTIVETPSNDATLTGLEVAGYPFIDKTTSAIVAFTSTNLQYYIGNVENSTAALVVRATPSNAKSIVNYYDEVGSKVSCPEASGETPTDRVCTIPLNPGTGNDKSFTVEIIAPDGTTKKPYTIKFNKVSSSNAYLANILADAGNFDKVFNKATKTYTLKIPYDKDSVNLEFIAEQDNATIKINNDAAQFTPRTYAVTDLTEGESRTVSVQVIAEDGVTKDSYTVSVERATYTGSSDSTLASLSVSHLEIDDSVTNYALTPIFSSNTTGYSIGELPYSLAELQINAEPNIAASHVEYYVNGIKQENNSVLIPKESGTITVKVTSENGNSVSNYTISYTKHANNDAKLKTLSTDPSNLDQAFEPNLHSYNLTIDYDRRSVDLVMESNDPNATIKINGTNYINNSVFTLNNLPVGATTASIVVTAEDGTTQETYKININREGIEEQITSVEFGHDISDGYIKTVSNRLPDDNATTVLDMKNQLDNDNSKLEIWNASDDTKLTDSDYIGTGMIVKLIIDGNVADSKVIVIKGDTNGDGDINVIDASSVVNHFLDRTYLVGAYLVAADVNVDTNVNVIDAAQIINHFLDRQRIEFKS